MKQVNISGNSQRIEIDGRVFEIKDGKVYLDGDEIVENIRIIRINHLGFILATIVGALMGYFVAGL